MSAHPASEQPSHGRDTGPAFMGFIIGAIVLFCLLFAIVKLTNAHYEHAEASATTSGQASSAQ